MTSHIDNHGPSGRRSDRVEQDSRALAGQAAEGTVSAPESIAPRVLYFAGPDRAALHGLSLSVDVPRARTSRRLLVSVRHSLSDRDWAVLASLDDHPYLTTLQLQRLHFADHATPDAAGRVCRRVLQRLAELRLIEHLERRVGGVRAGSASYVWRLGPVGDRLLRQASGDSPRARRKEPSLRHLDHCLAVAETRIRLLEAARDEHTFEVLRVQTEPACWRSYLHAGATHTFLKPDLYAVTATTDYEDHWFIEVDRGTESLPTLLRKCAQYQDYRRLGIEQQRLGVYPLVLWLLPSQRRVDQLGAALRRTRPLDADLFRLITPDGLLAVIAGVTGGAS